MAILRSLRALVIRNCNSRSLLLPCPRASPYPILGYQSFFPRSKLLSPLSTWMIPFQGPLFLSSSPWMLCQSATPLYLQSDTVLLPKIPAFGLLRRRELPVNLGFEYVTPVPRPFKGSYLEPFFDREVAASRRSFLESFVNVPNMISMCRLISAPFIGWMIVNEMYSYAFVGLAISGATDWIDGFVARKMGIDSVVGSYLDPLADKVLIGCVALAMVEMGLLHSGLVGVVVLRDVILIGGALYKRASSLNWAWKSWYDFLNLDGACPQKVEPLMISKVNTVFQLVLVAAALLQPEFGTPETQSYITCLSWLVALTTVASTLAYGAHLRGRSVFIGKIS